MPVLGQNFEQGFCYISICFGYLIFAVLKHLCASMRILELNFERTWRGGERQTLYDMKGFKSLGQDVAVLCRKGYPLEQKAMAEGFEARAFSGILSVIFFLVFGCRRYDVLHVQTSHMLTWAVLTKPFHGAKVVFTRRIDFVPRKWITRVKYKLADNVVAISTAIKSILEDFVIKNVALISEIVIPKQLDKGRGETLLRNLNIPHGTHVLATTSALVQHKDPLTMVEAIRLLKEKRHDFVFLHFGNGVLEQAVKDKVGEYGLEDVYKMMGFHDNAEDFFAIMDIFLMSSEEEGLGSSVLDAFIYRVPVVSTNAGGLKDLLQDGRGMICAVKDPRCMADGVDRLLNDNELKRTMTEKAYQYVVDRHNVQYISSRYLDLLS